MLSLVVFFASVTGGVLLNQLLRASESSSSDATAEALEGEGFREDHEGRTEGQVAEVVDVMRRSAVQQHSIVLAQVTPTGDISSLTSITAQAWRVRRNFQVFLSRVPLISEGEQFLLGLMPPRMARELQETYQRDPNAARDRLIHLLAGHLVVDISSSPVRNFLRVISESSSSPQSELLLEEAIGSIVSYQTRAESIRENLEIATAQRPSTLLLEAVVRPEMTRAEVHEIDEVVRAISEMTDHLRGLLEVDEALLAAQTSIISRRQPVSSIEARGAQLQLLRQKLLENGHDMRAVERVFRILSRLVPGRVLVVAHGQVLSILSSAINIDENLLHLLQHSSESPEVAVLSMEQAAWALLLQEEAVRRGLPDFDARQMLRVFQALPENPHPLQMQQVLDRPSSSFPQMIPLDSIQERVDMRIAEIRPAQSAEAPFTPLEMLRVFAVVKIISNPSMRVRVRPTEILPPATSVGQVFSALKESQASEKKRWAVEASSKNDKKIEKQGGTMKSTKNKHTPEALTLAEQFKAIQVQLPEMNHEQAIEAITKFRAALDKANLPERERENFCIHLKNLEHALKEKALSPLTLEKVNEMLKTVKKLHGRVDTLIKDRQTLFEDRQAYHEIMDKIKDLISQGLNNTVLEDTSIQKIFNDYQGKLKLLKRKMTQLDNILKKEEARIDMIMLRAEERIDNEPLAGVVQVLVQGMGFGVLNEGQIPQGIESGLALLGDGQGESAIVGSREIGHVIERYVQSLKAQGVSDTLINNLKGAMVSLWEMSKKPEFYRVLLIQNGRVTCIRPGFLNEEAIRSMLFNIQPGELTYRILPIDAAAELFVTVNLAQGSGFRLDSNQILSLVQQLQMSPKSPEALLQMVLSQRHQSVALRRLSLLEPNEQVARQIEQWQADAARYPAPPQVDNVEILRGLAFLGIASAYYAGEPINHLGNELVEVPLISGTPNEHKLKQAMDDLEQKWVSAIEDIFRIQKELSTRGVPVMHLDALNKLQDRLTKNFMALRAGTIEFSDFYKKVNRVFESAENQFKDEGGIWNLVRPVLNTLIHLVNAIRKIILGEVREYGLFKSEARSQWERSEPVREFKQTIEERHQEESKKTPTTK